MGSQREWEEMPEAWAIFDLSWSFVMTPWSQYHIPVAAGAYPGALTKLKKDILQKMDGYLSGAVDANDWINDLAIQKQLGSEIQTIWIILVILGG